MENGIDMEEAKKEIDEFATFNDFFYRELKEGARQVAGAENVLASPRITSYNVCYTKLLRPVFSNIFYIDILGDRL